MKMTLLQILKAIPSSLFIGKNNISSTQILTRKFIFEKKKKFLEAIHEQPDNFHVIVKNFLDYLKNNPPIDVGYRLIKITTQTRSALNNVYEGALKGPNPYLFPNWKRGSE